MAKFDIIVSKKENYKGYTGNPPSNESEYDAMKTDMFSGSAPTWTEIKNEMDRRIERILSLEFNWAISYRNRNLFINHKRFK